MAGGICFAGLDVHARKVSAAVVLLGSGEVFRAGLGGVPAEAIMWLQSLPGDVRAVSEAGPTGFGLARAARAGGLELMVCSPGAIPRQPGDRVKTDQRDALKLARLHAAGQLRPVLVPEPALEALRDLVRAREDLRRDLMGARHRISKMLLRRGHVWIGPGETWAESQLKWLSKIRFDEPLADTVFGEYIGCHQVLLARRDRLDRLIEVHAVEERWAPLVGRLRCLRGIDTLSAVGLVAEIGDPHAFSHPKRLASYLGLVPSEQSSGQTRRQGSITKAGSSHARRLLVEAAWLPPPTADLTRRETATARTTTRGGRGGLASAAAPPPTLGPSRRRSRQAPHLRRDRRRTRARLLRLGNRQTTRRLKPARGVGGGRRAHTGTRDSAMSTHHRSARSILDSGPSATKRTSCGTQPAQISPKRTRRSDHHPHPEPHRPRRPQPSRSPLPA